MHIIFFSRENFLSTNQVFHRNLSASAELLPGVLATLVEYYLHHDIYDTPLLEKSKEKKLASRLCCYNYILIPSFKNLNIFNDLFYKSKKKQS